MLCYLRSAPYNKKGFTLVEILVALTLFMLIMGIVVSIFVSMVSHQKRILVQQEFLSQTSYAMEVMSKSIRQAVKDQNGECLFEDGKSHPGYIFLLTHYNAQTGASEGIKFINHDGRCEEFFKDKDGILKELKGGGGAQSILSDKFFIKDLKFIINGDKNLIGAVSGEFIQPRITIILRAVVANGRSLQERTIQTTVSQLDLND